ncbi:hypothetical protein JT26_08935 [Porphyromonas sp. COT-108 OH1349]|nr:hypothetical protein JT26_08935 [Porphyromonas sp. COT-108 OH1349]
MLIDDAPLLIFLSAHFQEVCKEVGFHFGSIEKTKLFIDKRLYTDTSNSFRLVQHIHVKLSLHLILRMGVDVDAEILPTAHLHGFGIARGWIIIEIERYTPVSDSSLSERYFGTSMSHRIVD